MSPAACRTAQVPLEVGGAGGEIRLHRLQGVEVVLEHRGAVRQLSTKRIVSMKSLAYSGPAVTHPVTQLKNARKSHRNPVLTEGQSGSQKARPMGTGGLSHVSARNRGLLRAPLHESTASWLSRTGPGDHPSGHLGPFQTPSALSQAESGEGAPAVGLHGLATSGFGLQR